MGVSHRRKMSFIPGWIFSHMFHSSWDSFILPFCLCKVYLTTDFKQMANHWNCSKNIDFIQGWVVNFYSTDNSLPFSRGWNFIPDLKLGMKSSQGEILSPPKDVNNIARTLTKDRHELIPGRNSSWNESLFVKASYILESFESILEILL